MALSAADGPFEVNVLTWNLQCVERPLSQHAPRGFTLFSKMCRIAQLVGSSSAQLVCLQEAGPSPVDSSGAAEAEALAAEMEVLWYDLVGRVLGGGASAPCRGTLLYARRELQAVPAGSAGPVAIARFPLPRAAASSSCWRWAYWAGCHLSPFRRERGQRLAEVQAALRMMPPRAPLVLAGDVNMSEDEDGAVEALGLADAFVQLGSPPAARHTWDNEENLYSRSKRRGYQARYDRVYLRGFQALELVGNQPVGPKHSTGRAGSHYLSRPLWPGGQGAVASVASVLPLISGGAEAGRPRLAA